MHNVCTSTKCISCTVAVESASTQMASSLIAASGFGAGPVSAQVVTPVSCAALTAASTLGLVPLVDNAISTSPGRPCARTPRANISSGP
jgi:hypothetical protein